MQTVFVLLEDTVRDSFKFGEESASENAFLVRGITETLEDAIGLVSIFKLSDSNWDYDNWQIEEVNFGEPIVATNSAESCFGIGGSIAMYDVNGELLRTSDMRVWPSWLQLRNQK